VDTGQLSDPGRLKNRRSTFVFTRNQQYKTLSYVILSYVMLCYVILSYPIKHHHDVLLFECYGMKWSGTTLV